MERAFDPEIWREVTGGAVAERVRRLTRVTPLVPAPALGRRTGADVWLKLENLQRTGSFKVRGAAARLAALAAATDGKPKRVVAASAGNHGLGVALAARTFGIDATVIVSAQTPEVKRAGIAALGAKVEIAGASFDEAQAVARARAADDDDLVFVSAFDDDHVIAGNGGLLAREILAQLPDVQAVVV
ncbi:MAG TPA: pyridoxal-phosphate dependent enzyme, partial [Polyangia bacterium]|nr:pyridoxal-phosphate dependent enzyme [Polyangia bacterium]